MEMILAHVSLKLEIGVAKAFLRRVPCTGDVARGAVRSKRCDGLDLTRNTRL